MKLLQLGLIIFITISISTCTKADKNEPQSSTVTFELTTNQAGPFNIGDAIPDSSTQFEFRKEQRPGPEGTPPQETIYVVSQGQNDLLVLTPEYDSAGKIYTNKIAEIMVLSNRFKTDEGIAVGSTIQEFTIAYPNYKLWYTYVSDRFIMETDISQIQFLLGGRDFNGTVEPIQSEIMPLSKSDFSPNAEIQKIRLY